jgi:hypothetical protein
MSHQDTPILTIMDIQEKALLLPGRPQFWTSHHLAEFYQTKPIIIMKQLRRNPDRFPADFWFELRKDEIEVLIGHYGLLKRLPRGVLIGFTKAGALALSGVLKTPVADAVSVQIIRAVIAMEERAMAVANFLLQKVRDDYCARKPIMGRIRNAVAQGWTFDMLNATVSMSRPLLVQAIKDMLRLKLIETAPSGTPWEKAPDFIDPNQMDMFRDV